MPPDNVLALRTQLADSLRNALPVSGRRAVNRARLRSRKPTSALRLLPSFLVIGTQRGGTSSLFKYLARHPEIAPSLRKETEYFHRHYQNGTAWYAAHFPLVLRRTVNQVRGRRLLPFEATPTYLFDRRVPARVSALLPEAKFIVLLRDPVARAVSGWQHMRSLGFETLDFEQAIRPEGRSRYEGEEARMLGDPRYYSRAYFRFAYLERGHYADQLELWFRTFNRNRFLVLESESFYKDPGRAFSRITEFLGVTSWTPGEFKVYSSATSKSPIRAAEAIPERVRDELAGYYEPHNRRLRELVGNDFRW